MTNNEIEKLSKSIATEFLHRISEDENLLNALFPPKCMNIKEAAEYTRVPVNTLYQKVTEIPHMKVGKRLIFTDRGLISWMKQQ